MLWPEPSLLEAPAVDDVTDQIKVLGLDVVQKIEQTLRLAAGGAEM
jgi:hypothetical protein